MQPRNVSISKVRCRQVNSLNITEALDSVFTDQLPHSATGKVSKARLRETRATP